MKTWLARKIEVKDVLDLGDRNRENDEKLQSFDSSYFLSKSRFEGDGTKIIYYFHQVVIILRLLQVLKAL